MSKPVRARYAPSPTGYMHIGNVKAALNEYLVSKSQGGAFILRIEDTDQKREVPGAVQVIYDTLKILGIRHDEGPDVGGDYGPYIQSERKASGVYTEAALLLVEAGKAYYCFCSKERLETLTRDGSKDAVRYDRHCLGLSPEDVRRRVENGEPYVIRQLIPEGRTSFSDELFGEISVDNAELDDQILIKSDGFPTYNFANVVDDNAMGITHVVRGTEYLSSAPKYNLLYDAFGWDIPKYIHVPMILNEEGKKYSKRLGAPSVQDLVAEGFLPEALVNFIALLGWSGADNNEFFTLEELEKAFSVSGMSKSPSIVDMQKLRWMNSEYFKRMDPERFFRMAEPVLSRFPFDAASLAAMVKPRITFLSEIPEMLGFLLAVPPYGLELYENKKQKSDTAVAAKVLGFMRPVLERTAVWDNDSLYAAAQSAAAENGLKNSQILWPVRVALSGKAATPCGATELLELLGRDESLKRLDAALERLKTQTDVTN